MHLHTARRAGQGAEPLTDCCQWLMVVRIHLSSPTLSGHGILLDCAYLSFVTFTTLGYGEIVAQGYLRYLTGVEALTGFILITWSASFLFIEMQKYWTLSRSNGAE